MGAVTAAVVSPWLCPPQHTLQVGQDGGRSVTCMVAAGSGVWVALQGSAQVRLYHATTYEQLAEADITPPVHKMLAGKCHPWHLSRGCPCRLQGVPAPLGNALQHPGMGNLGSCVWGRKYKSLCPC